MHFFFLPQFLRGKQIYGERGVPSLLPAGCPLTRGALLPCVVAWPLGRRLLGLSFGGIGLLRSPYFAVSKTTPPICSTPSAAACDPTKPQQPFLSKSQWLPLGHIQGPLFVFLSLNLSLGHKWTPSWNMLFSRFQDCLNTLFAPNSLNI